MNIQSRINKIVFFYMFLLTLFLLLRWPISTFDTDLWSHLDGGRYLFENLEIFKSSYFSFLAPERELIHYYWMFQAIAYLTYSISGYYGLIVLRALAFSLTIFCVFQAFPAKLYRYAI